MVVEERERVEGADTFRYRFAVPGVGLSARTRMGEFGSEPVRVIDTAVGEP